MKKNILLIDIDVVGHHMSYIKSLCKVNEELNNNIYIMLPEKKSELRSVKYYVVPDIKKMKQFQSYRRVLKKIKEIVRNEKIDIIHFLSGDILYKFFGYGLRKFKPAKTIMTFHHFQNDFLHKLSIRSIFKKIKIGVCHTDNILNDLKTSGIKNVTKIEYPYFGEIKGYDLTLLKNKYEINNDDPIYLCLGETRYEKGIDLFLEACEGISSINLIIAGKERDITIKKINEIIEEKKLSFPIIKIIKFLTDEELNELLFLTNFVVLPYRRCFDGASGPLVEGVMYNKCIIGPNHGSLGDLICKYHLGYCFETENKSSLHEIINLSKTNNFEQNENYQIYRNQLSVESFILNYKKIYKEDFK